VSPEREEACSDVASSSVEAMAFSCGDDDDGSRSVRFGNSKSVAVAERGGGAPGEGQRRAGIAARIHHVKIRG
jgi:hypothetical protein